MSAGKKVGSTCVGLIWLVMAGWNLIDLTTALGQPGAALDVDRLGLMLAGAVIGLPVGGATGVILGWLPRPRAVTVHEQVVLAMSTLGVVAMGVTAALHAAVSHPSDPAGSAVRLALYGGFPGLVTGFGLLLVATRTWRGLEELPQPRTSGDETPASSYTLRR